ncbi:NAD-dependent epimerase/dehydratase family protein [Rhodopila sp.]|uniref:NAD-dependent epimerase/dehydratase family protein n=1 Tax=Rhodopila sp. TaxID=2480087 RepID=UPI003D124A52
MIGGSGFVGSAVVAALAKRNDMRPIACMRRPRYGSLATGVETRICDASDPKALASALEGVSHAVNCVLGRPRTMVAATRNLCDVARTSGLRRIVHLSSMAVYGAATGLVDENTRPDPVDAYGQGKAECEAVVSNFVASGGDAIMIRPGCVYGPGGDQWVGRIARWLVAGRLGDLGDLAEGYCNLTFNDDLANAVIVSLLMTERVRGEVVNLADSDVGTWNQYFTGLGQAVGAPVRRISRLRMHLEAAVLAPPLQIAKIVNQRIGRHRSILPAPITPSLLRLWSQSMRLDCRRADALLRFPRTPPEQGLARSAEWFRSTITP